MPRKLPPLPRQTIQVGPRGRITIPDYLREAANLAPGSWIEIEAHPNLEECKRLTLRRSF